MKRAYGILLLMCSMVFLHSMEVEHKNDTISMQKIPSLLDLCKKNIIHGFGKDDFERTNNAIENIQIISSSTVKNFGDEFKNFFVQKHWSKLPCKFKEYIKESPEIILKNKDILYGILGTSIYTWNVNIDQSENKAQMLQMIDDVHRDKFAIAAKITCAIMNHDKSLLYTGAKMSDIILWDITLNTRKGILPTSDYCVNDLTENNNGDLCSLIRGGEIKIWDIATQSCKQTLPAKYSNVTPWRLLSVDTNIVCSAGGMGGLLCNGPILIYDVREGKCIDAVNSHGRSVTSLAKSKKEMQFYSTSYDGTIRVWDLRKMKDSVHILSHDNSELSVLCAQENKEGTELISGGKFGIRIWNLTTDVPCLSNKIADDAVRYMVYDEDESRLLVSTTNAKGFFDEGRGVQTIQADCSFEKAITLING